MSLTRAPIAATIKMYETKLAQDKKQHWNEYWQEKQRELATFGWALTDNFNMHKFHKSEIRFETTTTERRLFHQKL